MFLAALGFVLLVSLPTDFANPVFGLILLLIGIAMGMFAPISILFAVPRLQPDRAPAGA